MQIAYYYQNSAMDTPESAARHQEICNLLSRLRSEGYITDYVIQDAEVAFPTEARGKLFNQLRDFALQHKVRLARAFGSQRYGFCYLPQQFLLVSEDDQLREVFPCAIGRGGQVEPLEFLTEISRGRSWTTRSVGGMEGRKHKSLVAQILGNPGMLEPGLIVRGRNVQVSQDFGELGFVDLAFEDCQGRPLLVEVKVGPNELDKAIGQIMRHRYLFARQNRMDEASIRIGIACRSIPMYWRSICASTGIACFEVPETLGK